MRKITILLLVLLTFSQLSAQVLTERKVLPQPSLNVKTHGDAVAIDGNRLVASSDLRFAEKNFVRSFDLEGDAWVQKQLIEKDSDSPLIPGYSNLEQGQLGFGTDLEVNGDWLVVAADYWFGIIASNDYYNGELFIYKRNGNTWEEHSSIIGHDQNPNTLNYGRCISIQGNWLFIGSPGRYGENTSSRHGRVDIFQYNEGTDTWGFYESLLPPNPVTNEEFGAQLKADGDKLIVTSYYKTLGGNSRAGAVYFYTLDGGTWNNRQDCTLDGTPANAYFGEVASLSGDYAFATYNSSGKDIVRIFRHDGSEWDFYQDLDLGSVTINAGDIDGDFMVFADHDAWYGSTNSGVVYLVEFAEKTWSLNQAITPSDGASADEFGCDVYLKGGRLAVGSHYHDDPASTTGAVYVYTGFMPEPVLSADFIIDPMYSPATTVVQYTDNSSATNTAIVSWSWDFNNDGIEDSDLQNPTHQFASAGNYPVTLTVSDGTISSSVTKWVSHTNASNLDCLAYIPFRGVDTEGMGIAGWNTDGSGEEPAKTGHFSHHTAYYYLASRDYSNIDNSATAAMKGNAAIVNWPNLTQALADNGKTYEDLEISFGLMTLGPDVENQDWTLDGLIETRKYRDGKFYVKLNGEDMITGDMPVLNMIIRFYSALGKDDEIEGETEFAIPVNNSESSSAVAQAIASAFMKDCEYSSIKLFFASLQPATQMEFVGSGRDGGFFNAAQAFLLRGCDCDDIRVNAYKTAFVEENQNEEIGVYVRGGDGNYTYSWSPTDNLNDSSVRTPILNTDTDGTYYADVVDGKGCRGEDSLRVVVMPADIATFSGKGEWSDAGNWLDNEVPANGAPVYLQDGTVVADIDAEVTTMYADSATLVKIQENVSFRVDSIYQVDTTAIVSIYSFGSEAGNFICNNKDLKLSVARDFSKDKWHYFGVPINSECSAVEYFKNFYVAQFNESKSLLGGWEILTADSALKVGRGYAAYYNRSSNNDTTVHYAGIMNTGTIEVATQYTDASHGWNLISNPYTCTVDWELINNTLEGVNDAIYLWDPNLNAGVGGYATYVAGESTNGQTQYIPAGQGFFVHAAASNGKVVFTNEARSSTKVQFKSKTLEPVISLGVTDEDGMTDETIIRFMDESSSFFDAQFDAYKLKANNNAPVIYSTDGFDIYTINSLPSTNNEMVVIPISVELRKSGTHELSLLSKSKNTGDLNVTVSEQNNEKSICLTNGVYSINGKKGDVVDLQLTVEFTQTTTNEMNRDKLELRLQDGVLDVRGAENAAVTVFGIDGKAIASGRIFDNQFTTLLPKGIVIVKVIDDQGNCLVNKLRNE